jgi:CDGSH-type Zn-finger protein
MGIRGKIKRNSEILRQNMSKGGSISGHKGREERKLVDRKRMHEIASRMCRCGRSGNGAGLYG